MSLAGPSRSRRAISESCRVRGTAPGPSERKSSTAFVNSSANSGTPSLRVTISRISASSICIRLATFRINAAQCSCPICLQVISVPWGCSDQFVLSSGRWVIRTRACSRPMRFSKRSINVCVVWSLQCASSSSSSTGPSSGAINRSSRIVRVSSFR